MRLGAEADHAGSPLLDPTTVRRPMKPSMAGGRGKPTNGKKDQWSV